MIRWHLHLVFALLILSCLLSSSAAAFRAHDNVKPSIHAVRVPRPLQLTGKLDDPLWKQAKPIQLAYEIQPGENTNAPQQTVAMTLFTNDMLYIGFQCFDTNPQAIRANLTDRDKIFQDDFVMVILDTFGEAQRGYELGVNPFGVQGDLMRTANSEDESFDIIWHSAAARNDSGWTAELAIPFKSLRFVSKEENEWTIIFLRNYPRTSRVITSWTPFDRNIPNDLVQGGRLLGLKGIESSGSIELLPYVMGQQQGARSDPGNPSSSFGYQPMTGRIGGGIQYSPNPNFSLDAVINPDFSQIESDADQISVNTTFALYYQERRPFFLVGQELFNTPMYYSRSINNPLGGGRIVGKTGSLSYQYLGAYDRNTPFVVPGEEQSSTIPSSVRSFANIGRLRYDLGDEAFLGALVTTRNMSGGHNYLAGIDWNYKFWNNWYLSGEAFISQTKELNNTALFGSRRTFGSTGITAAFDGEEYSGTGFHFVLSKQAREYGFDFVYNAFSPTYQAYNGLFDANNFHQLFLNQRYTLHPTDFFIDRAQFNVAGKLVYNYDRVQKEQVIQPGLSLTMKGQTQVRLDYLLINDEMFRGVWFDNVRRVMFFMNARPWNELSVSINGQAGKFIYRSYTPLMGSGHNFGSTVTLKPTSKFQLNLSYSGARLSNDATNELLYDGNIYRMVGIYQFTPELFFRTILQYNSFDKSLTLYPLFNYKLNAFTTFYAGLTNDYLDYDEPHGFASTARQYFVKIQYLLGT